MRRLPGLVLVRATIILTFSAWSVLESGSGNAASPTKTTVDEISSIAPLSRLAQGRFTGDLPAMRKRGLIRVLVTHSRTDFFLTGGRIRGIQAEFVRAYAKFLNQGVRHEHEKVKILYIPVTFDELLPALERGQGDIAAAFLTITPEREKRVDFVTGAKLAVNEILVTHASVSPPASIDELAGRELYVLRGSSYAEHLRGINREFAKRGLKPITIVEADSHLLSEDILEMVNAGVVLATVIDDYKGRLWQQVLRDIRLHEDIVVASGNSIGWAIRNDNPKLKANLHRFAGKAKIGTLLGNMLFKRYFKDTRWIENPLAEPERQRYARYVALFKKYGKRYHFDYLALLAQAFKESGLDASRRSHRGAVGLMQMLPSTAKDKHVGIPDIKMPEDNVHAATKYLAFLRDRYVADAGLSEIDRLAFIWAAYNAGPARLKKMRELAAKMGLDPNRWFGHVEVAAGRIVGSETVKYVADVYKYYVAYRLIERLRDAKTPAAGG